MIVYHGSQHNFRTLRIRKDLTKRSTLENEGYGVYFSLDKEVARSYGKYVYMISVNDRAFADMRSYKACINYVNYVSSNVKSVFGFTLDQFIDLTLLANYLSSGGVAISGVGHEVRNLLDSTEAFYRQYGRRVEPIFKWLERWAGYPKAYMFTYSIKDCGVIKDVSPNIAFLVGKECV